MHPTMTNEAALAYLLKDGNLAVPGGRYGSDTEDCAPVALALARIIGEANGDPMTEDLLDSCMSLVVNSHDDVESLLREHGTPEDLEAAGLPLTTLPLLAREALEHFETFKRDGSDETEHRTSDDAPEWVVELVRDAHRARGDLMMPDDWRYASIASFLEVVADMDEDEPYPEDRVTEWADGNVDVYNGARTAWLASHLLRASYVDDAAEEGLVAPGTDLFDRIGVGQYLESQEIAGEVLEALRERLEDLEG